MDASPPPAPAARSRSPLVPPLVALAVALAVTFAIQLLHIGYAVAYDRAYRAPYPLAQMPVAHADLVIQLGANEATLQGAPDYETLRRQAFERDPWTRQYYYPPLVSQLFAATNLLPGKGVHYLWLILGPLAVVLSFLALARALPLGEETTRLEAHGVLAVTLMGLALSTPLVLELERGNYDWLVLALYLLGLAALGSERPRLGGALIGVATLLKPYTAPAVLLLLVLRRRKAVEAALATMGVGFLLGGAQNHVQWLRTLGAARGLELSDHPWNAALANLVAMLLPGNDTRAAGLAYLVFLLLLGALLGVVAWRGRRRELDTARLGLLLLPLMFMTPPVLWGYVLFVLLAMLFALAPIYRDHSSLGRATLLMAGLIGLCQSPFIAARLVPAALPFVRPIFSASLLALAILGLGLVGRGACDREPAPVAPGDRHAPPADSK
jgi:hypothetical protein